MKHNWNTMGLPIACQVWERSKGWVVCSFAPKSSDPVLSPAQNSFQENVGEPIVQACEHFMRIQHVLRHFDNSHEGCYVLRRDRAKLFKKKTWGETSHQLFVYISLALAMGTHIAQFNYIRVCQTIGNGSHCDLLNPGRIHQAPSKQIQ